MFDWELCKLGGLATISSGGTPNRENPSYWNGDIPWATTTEVNYQIIKNTNEKITFEGLSNSSAKLMPKGTILMAMYGQGKTRGQVGILGIESTTNQANANIIVNNHTNNFFVYQQLVKKYEEIRKSANEGGQANLSLSIVKDITISWTPSLDEQKKIGLFFKRIDETIALHQDKLTQLKKLKDAFLQQMFPTGYEKSPRLRFGNFKKDWENCKLGKMLQEFSVKSKVENEYTVLSSTNNGMELREGRVSGASNIGYKIVENGDLVLSPQNLWLGNININNIGRGLVSPSYKTFKFIKVESNFINPQLRTAKMLEEYKNASTQGASVVRRNLEIDSFYQIPLRIPVRVEQDKIGLFFSNFDQYIDLHQKKLDTLKATKKAFLQKMFI